MPIRLEISKLYKSFRRLDVLEDINLSVEEGEFVAIVGSSGCGKTTLLRIVGGLLPPTHGHVLLDGAPVEQCRGRGAFGFVFQKPVLLPWRTVRQNVNLPLEILKNGTPRIAPEEIIRIVGLEGFEDNLPKQLSGGMQQRAALARVLVYGPSLVLMDEPFGALDEITRERMNYELLRIWSEVHPTILFVTHNLNEAVLISDRVVVLTERPATIRQVVEVGLPRPRTPEMASFPAYLETLKCVRELLRLNLQMS